VRQAVSSRWRGVTILGFVVLCLALPVLARAQETTAIPLGTDQDAAGQAPVDGSAPPPARSTTTVAVPREATWRKLLQGIKSPIGKGTSFPSGHALMSFSVATVFARRYRQHHWVPYVAYGLASVISFSRVTTGAHFPSDVFIGAALGYVIARYDVVRQ